MRFFLLIVIGFLSFIGSCYACTPCPELVSLEQVVKNSELIVIGSRADGPWLFDDNDNDSGSGPSTIEVKVDHILKGTSNTEIITIQSWFGMCAYGITLYKETALLILKQTNPRSEKNIVYGPVDFCGEKQFTIVGEYLTRQDNQGGRYINVPFMTVNEFQNKYLISSEK